IIEALLGPHHPDLIEPLLALSRSGRARGHGAPDLARRALEVAELSLGPDSSAVVPALAELASLAAGDDEAAALLRQAHAVAHRPVPLGDPDRDDATAALADRCRRTGREGEAEQFLAPPVSAITREA